MSWVCCFVNSVIVVGCGFVYSLVCLLLILFVCLLVMSGRACYLRVLFGFVVWLFRLC